MEFKKGDVVMIKTVSDLSNAWSTAIRYHNTLGVVLYLNDERTMVMLRIKAYSWHTTFYISINKLEKVY